LENHNPNQTSIALLFIFSFTSLKEKDIVKSEKSKRFLTFNGEFLWLFFAVFSEEDYNNL
jgi:hypothetical protein